ncbi:hypothetical protein F5B20DRAFT_554859, partial [Whalleya microplaca]
MGIFQYLQAAFHFYIFYTIILRLAVLAYVHWPGTQKAPIFVACLGFSIVIFFRLSTTRPLFHRIVELAASLWRPVSSDAEQTEYGTCDAMPCGG